MMASHHDPDEIPKVLFKHPPGLPENGLAHRTYIERQTFRHLDNLKELEVLNLSSWTPVKFPELVISKKSPLYESIKSGETRPSRYMMVETADS